MWGRIVLGARLQNECFHGPREVLDARLPASTYDEARRDSPPTIRHSRALVALANMSELTTFRVAGVQMEPRLGRLDENLGVILERLGQAAAAGRTWRSFPSAPVGLWVFQPGGRVRPCGAGRRTRGGQGRGSSPRKTGCACAFGLLERDGTRLFNACVLVGPRGVIGSYRKVHLPYLGIDMFVDPGDRPFAVHDVGGLRVGMHICYDGSFPETARVMTLLGADLLILPTNWPTHSECAAEHMIATRAMENTVYVMAVNRVGVESGFRFIGSSSIADPSGKTLARAGADREEIIIAEIDPRLARNKHLVRVPGRHEIDRIADRRPAFYGPLVEDRASARPKPDCRDGPFRVGCRRAGRDRRARESLTEEPDDHAWGCRPS